MTDNSQSRLTVNGAKVDKDIEHFLCTNESYRPLYSRFRQIESNQYSAVSVIQTHCARLYLADDFVIKIKRPVAYSYINLTELSVRRKICERELELNQPILPDIYLGVAAIVESGDGQLSIALNSEIIAGLQVREWCLIMRRFDEACVLDNVAIRGKFNAELAIKTGHSIALYHHSLPPVDCNDGDIRVDELIAELEFELKLLNQCFSHDLINRLIDATYRRYREVKVQLRQRSEQGFVRRCHGDLHLRNMLMRNEKPVPFDALEFDERLATTDVLYDLAFLIMDLCHRDLIPAANAVLNEYLIHSDERNVTGVALLDLYISIRASIKAMTTAQSMSKSSWETGSPETEKVRAEALSYINLAQQALVPKRPLVVAIGGFSGSGKSTIARKLPTRLCPLPGAVLLSSDTERKSEFNVKATHRLEPEHYNSANADRVYNRLFDKASRAIDAGYPVVVDATFLTQDRREQLQRLAAEKNTDYFGFWLMAPVEIMRNRIESRHEDASDADVSVLEKQLKQSKGDITWRHIDTDSPVDCVVKEICQSILPEQSKLGFEPGDVEHAGY